MLGSYYNTKALERLGNVKMKVVRSKCREFDQKEVDGYTSSPYSGVIVGKC